MGWLARLWAGLVRSPLAGGRSFDDLDDEPGPAGGADDDAVAVLPIDGEIDLHHFAPRDVPSVVDEYLRAAWEAGLAEVTIIHGRGKGVQRQVVRHIAEGHPAVAGMRAASGARATGATVVQLNPPPAGRGPRPGRRPRRAAAKPWPPVEKP